MKYKNPPSPLKKGYSIPAIFKRVTGILNVWTKDIFNGFMVIIKPAE